MSKVNTKVIPSKDITKRGYSKPPQSTSKPSAPPKPPTKTKK